MIPAMLRSLGSAVFSVAVSYLPVVALNLIFDALDEAMETLFENEQAKADATPEAADNRRLALYRKYWEGFKEYRDRKKSASP